MEAIETFAENIKLLSDKNRLMILAMLKDNEMCVCDIVDALETTQPNVSQHLRKLKAGGLVKETRRSQWIYYSLQVDDKPYLQEIINQLPTVKKEIRTQNQTC